MIRSRVTLDEIASWDNLNAAFGRAALSKRGRGDVEDFRSLLHDNVNVLRHDLRSGDYVPAAMRNFTIRDPKPRMIHAPAFRDRVVHHAMMEHMGPVLDNTLIDNSFACRKGKGSHAAVRLAAQLSARSKWLIHADVSKYFASIDHALLKSLIRRKFSDYSLLQLVDLLVDSHGIDEGLPIGALTSQYFANFYLGTIDRLVSMHPDVNGYVRYMDDMVWWCASSEACESVLHEVVSALEHLKLRLKPGAKARPTSIGFTFCGYRILPGRVLLSKRGRRRMRYKLAAAEAAFFAGINNELELQRHADAILAYGRHGDGRVFPQLYELNEIIALEQ